MMIDPHLHIDSCRRDDLASMATASITAVITLSYYPHLNLAISAQTILDSFERALKFETWRGKQELIDVHVGISLNPVSIPTDYEKVLEAIPKYLAEHRIVAIGEIGLEPGSKTCPDLALQEEIVRAQLKIAKEHNMPVVFHTPHSDKEAWVEQYLDMIAQENVEPTEVVIDHADASVTKKVLDSGCNLGITVQTCRGLGPQDAAKILKDCALDKVLIDSDCNIALLSDKLSVPKTALEMRRIGFSEGDIKRVVFDNPMRLFSLA
jgi:predicted metal-dependent TIM-barrel fold hydrolase